MPDKTLVSLRNLLTDRDTLANDRKKYETQLRDQKGYMDAEDYRRKKRSWADVIKTLDKQIALIDDEIQRLVGSDEKIKLQTELLKTVDGVGDRIAVRMVVVTMAFTRFETPRQFNCYAGLAPFRYTSGKSVYSKSKVSQRANKQIKSLLHLAAVCVATRMKSGEYKHYYKRKTEEGKTSHVCPQCHPGQTRKPRVRCRQKGRSLSTKLQDIYSLRKKLSKKHCQFIRIDKGKIAWIEFFLLHLSPIKNIVLFHS